METWVALMVAVVGVLVKAGLGLFIYITPYRGL
jgi:hypothetical protein